MKKNDNGMDELLELLKSHPHLVSALVFNPTSIKRFLESKAARRLLIGVDIRALLAFIAGPAKDAPVMLCVSRSRILSPFRRCLGRSRPFMKCVARSR
jgi:hypothetical protein